MLIIQIVPKLPPAIDGLGDYALNLARQFRQEFGIETCFIVSSPSWSGEAELEGFPVLQVAERSPLALSSLLSNNSANAVLLHYVGYGYAKRGCPFWLVDGLQQWQLHHSNPKLVTMFHEVYASGPPWSSSFWLSSFQKHIAGQLARMSDRIVTSNQVMAGILSKLGSKNHTSIPTLPVFSNIGESNNLPTLQERQRQLVVFGHRNSRLQVYQQCQSVLEQVCRELEIEVIYDIGATTGLELRHFSKIPIVEKGITEATEICSILSNSVAGFLNFPPPLFLAKSTIFAAYCAHRLIPCMVETSSTSIDGLLGGKHYWVATEPQNRLDISLGQIIADNAYHWYQTHSLAAQAKTFANYLGFIEEEHR